MEHEEHEKWNKRHREAADRGSVAAVLKDNAHLLPPTGLALDLACGRGANALFLARAGLTVEAWDLADVAIASVAAEAQRSKLTLHARVRDVVLNPPAPVSFDVIVVSHFFDRAICPALIEALRPCGLLFYQTWTRTRVNDAGPRNERFRLHDSELLELFAALQLRVYREEGRAGDAARGFRNQAMFVGEKPAR